MNDPTPTPSMGDNSLVFRNVEAPMGHEQTAAAPHDPLATARTVTGRPIARSEINGDALLTLADGTQARAADLERAGVIRRGAAGYEVADPVAAQAPTDKPVTTPTEERMPQDREEALTAFATSTAPGTQMAALNDIVDHDEVSDAVVGRLASEMHLEPSVAREQVQRIAAAFYDQAAQAASETVGAAIDPDAFFTWASQHKPADLREAKRRIATERRTDGFRALATEYLANAPKANPEEILKYVDRMPPGWKVEKVLQREREVLVRGPDGSLVSWASFVRSGALRNARR